MPITSKKGQSITLTADSRLHKIGSPVVLFDGVCNLCNNAVQFILRNDKRKVFYFSSLQSNFGKQFMADSGLSGHFPDSVILYDNGQIYVRSDAIIRIAEILGGFYSLAVVFRIIPKSMRDSIYNFIANHRYSWFGKRESCMIPDPGLSDRFMP